MNSLLVGGSLALVLFVVMSGNFYDIQLEPKVYDLDPAKNEVLYRIDYWTTMFIHISTPYVWGADSLWGSDCSGSMARILKLSGLGGYPRTTSFKMWLTWPGKRWSSNSEMWDSSKFSNLLFFTYPNKTSPRPFGHTGMVRNIPVDDQFLFAEASFSKGYFKETVLKKNDYRDKYWTGLLELDLMVGKK